MKTGRSTGKPTAAQQRRFDAIKSEHVGCLVAHILGIGWLPAGIHHFTIGGHHGQKRRGHDFTIGLNDWSHQGYPLTGWTAAECERVLGPSFAKTPNAFRERFGSDDELLAMQNEILGF